MLGQGLDELVDFAVGVVDVGAGAEAAAADGELDESWCLRACAHDAQAP